MNKNDSTDLFSSSRQLQDVSNIDLLGNYNNNQVNINNMNSINRVNSNYDRKEIQYNELVKKESNLHNNLNNDEIEKSKSTFTEDNDENSDSNNNGSVEIEENNPKNRTQSQWLRNNKVQTFHTKNRQAMIENVLEREREEGDDDAGRVSKFFLHEKLLKFIKSKSIKVFSTQKSKEIEKKIYIIEIIINIILLLHIIASLIQSDMFAKSSIPPDVPKDPYKLNDTIIILRFVAIGLILPLIICLGCRYHYTLQLMRLDNLAANNDNICTSGLILYLFIEIILLSIFVPPYNESKYTITFNEGFIVTSLDSILCLFITLKLLYIIRFLTISSKWNSKEVKEMAYNINADIGLFFVFKAKLTKSPRSLLFMVFIFAIGIYGYLMRTFEIGYHLKGENENDHNVFYSYADTLWLVVVTMHTIGYGDIYPKTSLGRVITYICTLSGVVIISIGVIKISKFLEFTPEEKKTYNKIMKTEDKIEYINKASDVITDIFALFSLRLKKSSKPSRVVKYLTQIFKFKEEAEVFSKLDKAIKANTSSTDEILSKFDRKLEKDVKIFEARKKNAMKINELVSEISINENQINNIMYKIDKTQDSITDFLIKHNRKLEQGKSATLI